MEYQLAAKAARPHSFVAVAAYGDYGPWYLSWLLGTGFMVLVAVSAGVLFEAQEDARKAGLAADITSVVAGTPPPGRGTSR